MFGGGPDVIDGATLEQIKARLAPFAGDTATLAGLRAAWETLRRPPERPSQSSDPDA